MTLEELQVVIEANIKPFKDAMQQAQNEVKRATGAMNNQVSKVKSIFSSLARTVAAIGIGKIFLDSVKSAMKVEGSIQQITRTMGESTNSFLKWSKESALAFNMSQSDAMNFGAIFSNLVSGFSSGTAQTMQYTTDLLKASSVIASGTGRTMTDVMERIRSGLLGNTEAIEDLGIYAQVGAMEATNAFKKLANGKSWDQLDYKTQQQIRLFSILEQTTNKFGGAVFNNTNSSLQQLVAILKDVALNLGNAFLPILNVVLPILSNFAMGLRTVTGYAATFMQALLGKSNETSAIVGATDAQTGYNSALADTGDTAKKTAKEMNRLLGGFDEINSLSKSDSDSGSSGVGSSGVPAIATPAVDTSDTDSALTGWADKIKTWVNSINFLPLINSFNGLKESISPIIDKIGAVINWLLVNILAPLAQWTIEDALPAFFRVLAGAFDVLNPILQSFMDLGEWLWTSFLAPIASWTGGVIVDVLNGLADVLSTIGAWMSDNQSVVDAITFSVAGFFAAWKVIELMSFINNCGGVIKTLKVLEGSFIAVTKAKVLDKIETIKGTILSAKAFVVSIGDSIKALVKQAAQFVIGIALKIKDAVVTGAMAAANGIWRASCAIGHLVKQAAQFVINIALKIKDEAVTGAMTLATGAWNVICGIGAMVKQAAQFVINTGLKIADTLATTAMTVATGIWNVVCGIATAVTWAFGAAVAFLTSPIGLVILAIVAVIAIVVLLVKNWDKVKEVATSVWAGIVTIWQVVASWFNTNVIQPLANFFSGLWNSIVAIFNGTVTWFSNTFSNAWIAIKGVFSGVGSFFGGVWGTIKEQFTNIGSAIGGAIGGAFKFVVNGIIGFAETTINGFIWAINGAIDLINVIPGVDISTISPIDVPRLARGGIVDSAQMFVAGEAGKEAVMPLENNTGWITQLAEKVATRMPKGGQGAGISGDLILTIDGSVIGKVALAQLRKMQRQGGITLMPI